ncbi:MAG: ribonuclease P protein component [Alphaproteobacteria bacterium]|nr:ribonuclease P protein component [Alphaproteobacteria bacterium]
MRTAGALHLQRLLNRADFLKAARALKAATPGLVLQVRARANDEAEAGDQPRVGFTASKKVGGSVVRNRARRRLHAAAWDVLGCRARSGYDYVLIARAGTPSRPYDALLADLTNALDRIEAGKTNKRPRAPRGAR